MAYKITIFVASEATEPETALQRVRDLVREGAEIHQVTCPPAMEDWFACPFARDQDGMVYYGEEGFNTLIERVHENGQFRTNGGGRMTSGKRVNIG